MSNMISVLIGAFVTLGILIFLKIVDMILEQWINKAFFGRIWAWATTSFKKFITRFKPIKTCFHFRIQFEPNELPMIKENIVKLIDTLSEKYKGKICCSQLTWNDINNLGSVSVAYNEKEYKIDIHVSARHHDLNSEEELLTPQKEASVLLDSIAFSIEVDFPFHMLDQMLLSLNALTNFIKEELKEMFHLIQFSKGMFTIAPIKGDFTMNHWVKEKQFEVSLLLKAQEKILVNLYPSKAEIIFPTLQIDDKVSEYLRGTLLNYYL